MKAATTRQPTGSGPLPKCSKRRRPQLRQHGIDTRKAKLFPDPYTPTLSRHSSPYKTKLTWVNIWDR